MLIIINNDFTLNACIILTLLLRLQLACRLGSLTCLPYRHFSGDQNFQDTDTGTYIMV